jgi:5-methylcytosine-specific restriction enzyme A
MKRKEFPKRVKLAAWERCHGHCEKCFAKLFPDRINYHHKLEDTMGGEPVLKNCQVLCVPCHSEITIKQAAVIAKSNRVRNRYLGIKPASKRAMLGSKDSPWKKTFNHGWVRR